MELQSSRHPLSRAAVLGALVLVVLPSCSPRPTFDLSSITPSVATDARVREYTVSGWGLNEYLLFDLGQTPGFVGTHMGLSSDGMLFDISRDGTRAKIRLGPLAAIDQREIVLTATDRRTQEKDELTLPISTDWDALRDRVEAMPIETRVGQTLVVGLFLGGLEDRDKASAMALETLPRLFDQHRLSGIFIHESNLPNIPPKEAWAGETHLRFVDNLVSSLRRTAGDLPPPFIAVDQEGGRGNTLRRGLTQFPDPAFLALQPDLETVYRVGRATGSELRALGVNVVFGPIVDIDRREHGDLGIDPIAGLRTFGADAEHVARYGLALAAGYRDAGVLPVAKHFPGHGLTDKDPHFAYVEVQVTDPEAFERVDLYPFRRLIEAGLPGIMTAHMGVPLWGPPSRSVTYSRDHLEEKLRNAKPPFHGIAFTDDMASMRSALTVEEGAEEISRREAVKRAHLAGNDIVLLNSIVPDSFRPDRPDLLHLGALDALIEELVEVYERNERNLGDLDERVLRILRTKAALAGEGDEVPASARLEGLLVPHRDLASEVSESSVVVLSERGILRETPQLRLFRAGKGPLSEASQEHPYGLRAGDEIVVASPVYYWYKDRNSREDQFSASIRGLLDELSIPIEMKSYPLVYGLGDRSAALTAHEEERRTYARTIWADPRAIPEIDVDFTFYRGRDGRRQYGGPGEDSQAAREVDEYLERTARAILEASAGARYLVFGALTLSEVEILHRLSRLLEESPNPPEDVLVVLYREPYLLQAEIWRSPFTVLWAPSIPDLEVPIETLFGKERPPGDFRSVPFRFHGRTEVETPTATWNGLAVPVPLPVPPVVPSEPRFRIPLIAGIAAALATLSLLWALQRRRRRKRSPPTPPELSEESEPEESENAWFRNRGQDTVLVFVHGYFSSNERCWGGRKRQNWWPRVVRDDPDLLEVDIFLGSYYTDLDSTSLGLRDSSEELFRNLDIPSKAGSGQNPLERSNLVFVCHSYGGAVVRKLLTRKVEELEGKRIGLLLFGSPSRGSDWATGAEALARMYDNRAAEILKTGSQELEDLHLDFLEVLRNPNLSIEGRELGELHSLVHCRWLPRAWLPGPVVRRTSAFTYFDNAYIIAGTNHFSLVAPKNRNAAPHLELKRFLRDKGFLADDAADGEVVPEPK